MCLRLGSGAMVLVVDLLLVSCSVGIGCGGPHFVAIFVYGVCSVCI